MWGDIQGIGETECVRSLGAEIFRRRGWDSKVSPNTLAHGIQDLDSDVYEFIIHLYPYIVIGSGSQMADVYCWPTPVHWDNNNANGFNWGHWTEWDEIWYQQRMMEILTAIRMVFHSRKVPGSLN